ncbi:MFS transporter [Candidatus Gracilibacteria bacterium]|nr:MFS transporter [Candidatus Gracilibacteria bacterium]NJM86428.1 MFS transporter [Hydrococcus sp. RU_2_2]NJP19580.1 MFS transporter [Hydrococcus sp. CRU_1_1]
MKASSRLTQLTLMISSTLTVMAGATIAPSLPAMREHFTTDPNADYLVRLTLTLPALFIALGAPLVGITIDRMGRKYLLILALGLYGIAGSSGFLLDSLQWLLVSRAFLGISVAAIMTISTTLIGDYYTGATRTKFLGLQASFMGLGGLLFLTVGGFLADISWRLPFLIYLISLALVPLAMLSLYEPVRNPSNPTNTITDEPQRLPSTLIAITYGIAILTQIVFYFIPVQLPFYLTQVANTNAAQEGFAIALLSLFSAISSIFYRQVKIRLNFIAIYGIAFINMALGYGIIGSTGNYGFVLVGLIITGSGLGLLMPNMNLCLTTVTPEIFRGRVMSGITTSFFLGQFLSPFVSQPLSKVVGLGGAYGWASGFMFILTLITLFFVWRSR